MNRARLHGQNMDMAIGKRPYENRTPRDPPSLIQFTKGAKAVSSRAQDNTIQEGTLACATWPKIPSPKTLQRLFQMLTCSLKGRQCCRCPYARLSVVLHRHSFAVA